MNPEYNRPVYLWLWSGVILITLMVIIGGITRLTDSGLSMSDWNLIMGSVPPMNEVEWDKAFERYKEFPQYQKLNAGMSLDEFKTIYLWEYLHRLIGRVVGIIFIVPFIWFWVKGHFDKRLLKRLWILLFLGASQGAMGWIMVKSGLVDVPYVSHYRLAIHFSLALILFAYCLWLALDVKYHSSLKKGEANAIPYKKWMYAIGTLLWLQIIYGAFTAGLDAGYMYNSFPKMGGEWLPPTFSALEPFVANLVENPGTVQWIHRVIGTILLTTVLSFWWKLYQSDRSSDLMKLGSSLLGVLVLQYLFGIFTVIYSVPIALGVLHQTVAVIFWGVFLALWHKMKYRELYAEFS
ncbi:COX15/CtaA family protein [Gracilimonas sp.]|uniref:COX15/CtaA family protein n=1 Tax=Gracilimonas sp. TaxID=1974203 RepID=UPI0028722516|nr:COX15/CtaA family protein [Gracilimonas sp.]